jgi:hypothetical protein
VCSEKCLDNDRGLDVSVLVSSEEAELNESVFSHSEWMKLQVSNDGQQHMHPLSTRALFGSQTWKQSEEDLSKIFIELFALDGDHLAPEQVSSLPFLPSHSPLAVSCPPPPLRRVNETSVHHSRE